MSSNQLPAGTILEITDERPKDGEPHITEGGDTYNIYDNECPADSTDRLIRIHKPGEFVRLTPEIVKAVKDLRLYMWREYNGLPADKLLWERMDAVSNLIDPPKPVEAENTKTCREKIEEKGKCDPTWAGQAIATLAEHIDRISDRLDAIEGKVKS